MDALHEDGGTEPISRAGEGREGGARALGGRNSSSNGLGGGYMNELGQSSRERAETGIGGPSTSYGAAPSTNSLRNFISDNIHSRNSRNNSNSMASSGSIIGDWDGACVRLCVLCLLELCWCEWPS